MTATSNQEIRMEINLGAAAFWIALAAVIISGRWFAARSEAMKHETIRLIVEKTGQVDEAKLKELLSPVVPPLPGRWVREPNAGGGYRAMRVVGMLIMFGALAAFVFFTIVWLSIGWEQALPGLATTSAIAVFGAGLFYTSRLMPRPPSDRTDPS